MEIHNDNNLLRTSEYVKRKTLKDGTIKEYKYQRSYPVKTDRKVNGKTDAMRRLNSCKDIEKIEKIKALFDELGI